jgi:hypothetical protein
MSLSLRAGTCGAWKSDRPAAACRCTGCAASNGIWTVFDGIDHVCLDGTLTPPKRGSWAKIGNDRGSAEPGVGWSGSSRITDTASDKETSAPVPFWTRLSGWITAAVDVGRPGVGVGSILHGTGVTLVDALAASSVTGAAFGQHAETINAYNGRTAQPLLRMPTPSLLYRAWWTLDTKRTPVGRDASGGTVGTGAATGERSWGNRTGQLSRVRSANSRPRNGSKD